MVSRIDSVKQAVQGSDRSSGEPAQDGAQSVSTALQQRIRAQILAQGGWIGFDRFMHEALYAPALGYYARGGPLFGLTPGDGSDFVTAPVLSPLFGRALAAQVRQALDLAGASEVAEFGAGSGALAAQLLDSLGPRVQRYTIVEVSRGLRERQRERLGAFAPRVRWVERLCEPLSGVMLGNEVLDAMPVRLIAFDGRQWLERGVVAQQAGFAFADANPVTTPPGPGPWQAGHVTEVHEQALGFVRETAQWLQRGLLLFIDYGFPQDEFHHPQRVGGTLMCHRGHRVDTDPLSDVGLKDITAHLDFTALALAAQEAGLEVAGYTSQARFLINCGIGELLQAAELPARAQAQKLLTEHEMGELFKAIAFTRGLEAPLIGFVQGDRTHRL